MVFPMESFKRDWYKAANLISLLRLILVGLPVALLLSVPTDDIHRWLAAGAFLTVALTDVVDGYVARRFNQVTQWGIFLDPLVDKVLVGAMLIAVSIINPLLWLVTAFVFIREVVVALQIRSRGKLVAAVWSGKLKMAAQVVMIAAWVMPISLWLQVLATVVAVVMTIWSWVDYYDRFVRKEKV